MHAPEFWNRPNVFSQMLSPLSRCVAAITRRRIAKAGWRAPIPVVCCGNATVGGAGKTTLTLDLAHRLRARGVEVHVLIRGYRGVARGPRRVMPDDTVLQTGDEALLLSEVATTWTGADRAASARSAIAAGAEFLLMDDGLQNPLLEKSASLLVIDGVRAFGNCLVFPAGPMREPVSAAASRCLAAVLIGPDVNSVRDEIQKCVPVLDADLMQSDGVAPLVGKRAFVFSGIAFPEKFFNTLQRSGVEIVGKKPFPDHHVFTASELILLETAARNLNAMLVTTPKDAVRLPKAMPVQVVGVKLLWKSEVEIETLLDRLISAQNLYSGADIS